MTLLLLLVGSGAAAAPHIFTVFLVTAFQALWHCFVKYTRGWGKT